MTHEENLKIVRDAAILANPEIAEPKFGCRVRITNLNGKKSVWELVGDVDTHSNQDRIWRNVDSEFATVEWGNFKLELLDGGTEVEVLGREITLPDVLLALGERANRFLDYRHFVASLKRENGTVTILDNSDSGGRLSDGTEICEWNLRLPLSGQSEETVAYLAGLITDDDPLPHQEPCNCRDCSLTDTKDSK